MRSEGEMSSSEAAAPGLLLRLAAVGGAVATLLVVTSAVLELGTTHWGVAGIALPLLAAVALVCRFAYPHLFVRALVALVLLLLAIALGGVVAWSDSADWTVALHVGAAAASLGTSLVVLASIFRGAPAPLASARDYLTLTKPRIMSLLLVTGAAGMFVGAQGVPPLDLFVLAMTGLALACGGASALNHVLDRDIDRLMGSRTERRPVASGRVSPEQALEFGIVLSALSFALLASTVNLLTAVLALVGNAFYVVVYTRWLKRTTPQNIVIGGAAGAVPPLVGYAAATGSLALPALWLFLIVFLWTPPHFWALALMIKNAYAAAGIPMLPVVRGDRETARQILIYSVGAGGVHDRGRALARARVHGGGARPRRGAGRARLAPPPRPLARAGAAPLPLLAPLPRAALRRGGRRPAPDLMNDSELSSKNLRFGWALFGLFWLLFLGHAARRAALPPTRLSGRRTNVSPDLELALRLADAADAISLQRFRTGLAFEMKADLTPVTEADLAVEAKLRALLAEARPEDAILGEEEGTTGSGARRWILDPIDGTRNYARGIPVWATLVALEEDGEVRIGVVSAPALARRWWAERGEGAVVNGKHIGVSSVAEIEDAVLSFALENAVPKIARRAWHVRGFGDFWSHMLVAEGAVDGVGGRGRRRRVGSRGRAGDRRGGGRTVHGLRGRRAPRRPVRDRFERPPARRAAPVPRHPRRRQRLTAR